MVLSYLSATPLPWLAMAVLLILIERFTIPPCAWDISILTYVDGFRRHWLDRIFSVITLSGSIFILAPLTAFLAWYWSETGRYDDACLLALGFTGASLIAHLTKLIFKRKRPDLFPSIGDIPSGSSFPSAHSAQIAAFIVSFYFIFKPTGTLNIILICIMAILTITLVSFSRIYLQVHYPSDVFAGIMLALLWVLGAENLLLILGVREI